MILRNTLTGRFNLRRALCLGLLLSTISLSSYAGMIFTDSSSFYAALSTTSNISSFDNVDSDTPIPNGGQFDGITYDLSSGRDLIVTDNFETTSRLNYLGADDGFANEFLSGEELFLSFGRMVQAFGLFIIGSPDSIFASDLQLVGGGLSVFNALTPEATLGDGGEVFFLGIINESGFDSARLNSFGDTTDPFFAFNIDDVSVAEIPEPNTFFLIGVGLLLLTNLRAIRNNQSQQNMRKNSELFIQSA